MNPKEELRSVENYLAKSELRYSTMIATAASRAQAEVKVLACVGITEALYLYYRPSTETEDGELRLFSGSTKPGTPWILATDEALKCNVPYVGYYQWVAERSRRLPVMAWLY